MIDSSRQYPTDSRNVPRSICFLFVCCVIRSVLANLPSQGLMYAKLKLYCQVSVLDSVSNGVLEKLRALTEYIHAPNNKASLLFYCFDTLTFYLILAGALATCIAYICV